MALSVPSAPSIRLAIALLPAGKCGGDVVDRHSKHRDVLAESCQYAHLSIRIC